MRVRGPKVVLEPKVTSVVDVEYEKYCRLVLQHWQSFIESDFNYSKFVDRLYKHLHLYCGFIAHYDRRGFYSTYFEHPRATIDFVEHFVNVKSEYWVVIGKYARLNQELCNIMNLRSKNIINQCLTLERELDIKRASQLLQKHGICFQQQIK